jgi:hypothetical protein
VPQPLFWRSTRHKPAGSLATTPRLKRRRSPGVWRRTRDAANQIRVVSGSETTGRSGGAEAPDPNSAAGLTCESAVAAQPIRIGKRLDDVPRPPLFHRVRGGPDGEGTAHSGHPDPQKSVTLAYPGWFTDVAADCASDGFAARSQIAMPLLLKLLVC